MTYKLDGAMALVKINVHVAMHERLLRERERERQLLCRDLRRGAV